MWCSIYGNIEKSLDFRDGLIVKFVEGFFRL